MDDWRLSNLTKNKFNNKKEIRMKKLLLVFGGLLILGLIPASYIDISTATAAAETGVKPPTNHNSAAWQKIEKSKSQFVEEKSVPENYLGMNRKMRENHGLHFFTPLPYPIAEYEDFLEIKDHGIAANYAGQQTYYVLLAPKDGVQLPFSEAATYYCFDFTESESSGLQVYLYKVTDFVVKIDYNFGTDQKKIYEAPNECSKPTEPVMFW